MARAEHSADDVAARAGGPCVVPTVRYRDVPAAIDWLCEAFGFQEHRVVAGKNGCLRYAELTFGGGMVMVAPVEESAMGKLMVQPGEIGGVETQICYLFVEDAKAHYARAKAAGADIVLDIEDQANCGRGYSCRDPEGHIWNFGTYDPWERQGGWFGLRSARSRRGRARKLLAVLLLLGVATAATVHRPARDVIGGLGAAAFAKVAHAVDAARADKGVAEHAAPTPDELRQQLAQAHAAKAAADRAAREARELLALEQRAREAAELAAKQLAERPAPQLNAATSDAAAKIALETRAQLEEARSAKAAAERAAKEARELLGQVRGTKQAADRAARLARDQARREYLARRAAAARAAAVAQAANPQLSVP